MTAGSDRILFLISQPRAGSTLLQKLIANSPEINTASEPWLLLPFLSVFREDAIEADYRHVVARRGILDYLQKFNLQETYKKGLADLILKLYPLEASHAYFLDKTPRYYEVLKEIVEIFPHSKILILKRHPFDALHSMIQTWSKGGFSPTLLTTFYRDFTVGPKNIQSFLNSPSGQNNNVKVIHYEELVKDPRLMLLDVFDWLDVPFNDSYLTPNSEKVKGIYGDDVYKDKPNARISSEGLRKWMPYLKDKEYRSFFLGYAEWLGFDFFELYGYPLESEITQMRYKKSYFRSVMKKVGEPLG